MSESNILLKVDNCVYNPVMITSAIFFIVLMT